MAHAETARAIAIFRSCFSGLDHVYGTYDLATKRIRQVKAPVTDRVIYNHLAGRQPYGVYLLVKDKTRAIAADFDDDDLEPVLAFVANAKRYDLDAQIERSKRKGWHCWVFCDNEGVSAAKARRVVRHILTEIGHPGTEVFPKHDALDTTVNSGNFIFAPMFGRSVGCGRTVFVDPTNPLRPHPDPWGLLAGVRRVSETELDSIIEINDLAAAQSPSPAKASTGTDCSNRTYGLLPCAKRMLAEGVTEFQRVSAFRLAVKLKLTGLPKDYALTVLNAWAARNRPIRSGGVIQPEEIKAQVEGAYGRDYRGQGCDDPAVRPFCDPSCPIYRQQGSGA